MNCEPILCNGNELEATLNSLRDQRMVPWAVDAMVKGNANYRVSYFERARSMDPLPKAVTEKPSNGRDSGCGETPIALNTVAGNKNGEDAKGAPVPSALAIQHSRKLDSLPSNLSVPVLAEPCKTVPREDGPKCSEARGSIRSCVTDTLAADKTLSINARLAALQAKLASAGKLKRSKPTAARLPYSDS